MDFSKIGVPFSFQNATFWGPIGQFVGPLQFDQVNMFKNCVASSPGSKKTSAKIGRFLLVKRYNSGAPPRPTNSGVREGLVRGPFIKMKRFHWHRGWGIPKVSLFYTQKDDPGMKNRHLWLFTPNKTPTFVESPPFSMNFHACHRWSPRQTGVSTP